MTAPYEVDGRKSWQWVESVRGYLDWRAGRAWRPSSHRFLPESFSYVQAINWLNSAQAEDGDCVCVYCRGAVFADARKAKRRAA